MESHEKVKRLGVKPRGFLILRRSLHRKARGSSLHRRGFGVSLTYLVVTADTVVTQLSIAV
jgi:hypothetical protein